MTTSFTKSFAWTLDAPREFLATGAWAQVPQNQLIAVGLSSMASYALGETVIAQHRDTLAQTFGWLAFTSLTVFLLFVLGVGLTLQLAQLFAKDKFAFKPWLSAASTALVPLHLILPTALVSRSMGTAGLLFYAIIKLAIFSAVLRRWMWAVHTTFAWPLWAAMLLLFTPLVICTIAVVLAVGVCALAVVLLLVGAAA